MDQSILRQDWIIHPMPRPICRCIRLLTALRSKKDNTRFRERRRTLQPRWGERADCVVARFAREAYHEVTES